MRSAGGSFGNTSLYVGSDWTVSCSEYPDALPILTVHAGTTSVTITAADRAEASEQTVAFARELAAGAARFADECQRLCDAQKAAGRLAA